jgi:hypothetical protein
MSTTAEYLSEFTQAEIDGLRIAALDHFRDLVDYHLRRHTPRAIAAAADLPAATVWAIIRNPDYVWRNRPVRRADWAQPPCQHCHR